MGTRLLHKGSLYLKIGIYDPLLGDFELDGSEEGDTGRGELSIDKTKRER